MANTTKWVATNAAGRTARGISVNGAPFFAKGVCYSPVPWGGSSNWTPFGDFFFPPWEAIWERDLPLMRAAGINTIRTYNFQTVIYGHRRDHTPFLDACWNGGKNPVYVLIGCGALSDLHIYDLPWASTRPKRDAAKAAFLDLVKTYGTHPAVMGFLVGNEVNNGTTRVSPDFWRWIDSVAAACRAAAPDKLSTISVVDDSMITVINGDQYCPNLSMWGINSYRGNIDYPQTNNFTDLWSSFARHSAKPMMITEWGAPASTHDAQGNLLFSAAVAAKLDNYVEGHYGDLRFNAVTTTSNGGAANLNAQNWAPVCVGSCYFEWTDEWWKFDADYKDTPCAATVQNPAVEAKPGRPGKSNAGFPGGWDDEECFGLNAIEPAGPDPMERPGPPGANPSCPGPWDFAANAPYPPDILHPRSTLATLTAHWKR